MKKLENYEIEVIRFHKETMFPSYSSDKDQTFLQNWFTMSAKFSVKTSNVLQKHEVSIISYLLTDELRAYMSNIEDMGKWTYRIYDHTRSCFLDLDDDRNLHVYGWIEKVDYNGIFEIWFIYEKEEHYKNFEDFFIQYTLKQ